MGTVFNKFGEIEVACLVTSRFKLDGGSMFGVVPRVLWEKRAPADERNRITLNVNSLLVRSCGLNVLVETGMGSKFDKRRRDIYALSGMDAQGACAGAGVPPEEVDLVVLTHLHLDHAGGSTKRDESGAVVPAFPRAGYVVQEEEWRAALAPHPLAKGSYIREDFEPLLASGRLELVSGGREVAPGVLVEPAGGHTPGHQVVRLLSAGEECLYTGDLVPTAAHLKLNWIMSWDLEPEVVWKEKARLLEDAAKRGVFIFLTHDPAVAGGRVVRRSESEYSLDAETLIEVEE